MSENVMSENVMSEKTLQAKTPINNENPVKLHKKKKLTVYNVVVYGVLGIFSLLCFFPLAYVLLLSFSTEADWMNSTLLVIPKNFHFENYKANLLAGYIPQAFGNSIFLVVAKTLYQMTLTSLAAYAFTRKDVPGIRIIFTLFVIPMFFGGGLTPFYLVVDSTIGTENLWSLIIPFGIGTFNMIILRNFFSQVPESIIDSCRLDGASEFRILFSFVIPLSKAGIATIILYYLVAKWDDWYWPSIFLSDSPDLAPLALKIRNGLNDLRGEGEGGGWDVTKVYAQGMSAATMVIGLIPIMAIYPFLQKYFAKGVMLGSVKG